MEYFLIDSPSDKLSVRSSEKHLLPYSDDKTGSLIDAITESDQEQMQTNFTHRPRTVCESKI